MTITHEAVQVAALNNAVTITIVCSIVMALAVVLLIISNVKTVIGQWYYKGDLSTLLHIALLAYLPAIFMWLLYFTE